MPVILSVVMMIWMSGVTAPERAVPLPDTPQGRHLQAWITAFNSGDEKTFLAANDEHMTPESAARNPPAQRATMFRRMRENFGALKVERIVKNTAGEMVVEIPTLNGALGTFTVTFEAQAPYRISRIGVTIDSARPGAAPA
jgi:hypothetical protein